MLLSPLNVPNFERAITSAQFSAAENGAVRGPDVEQLRTWRQRLTTADLLREAWRSPRAIPPWVYTDSGSDVTRRMQLGSAPIEEPFSVLLGPRTRSTSSDVPPCHQVPDRKLASHHSEGDRPLAAGPVCARQRDATRMRPVAKPGTCDRLIGRNSRGATVQDGRQVCLLIGRRDQTFISPSTRLPAGDGRGHVRHASGRSRPSLRSTPLSLRASTLYLEPSQTATRCRSDSEASAVLSPRFEQRILDGWAIQRARGSCGVSYDSCPTRKR